MAPPQALGNFGCDKVSAFQVELGVISVRSRTTGDY